MIFFGEARSDEQGKRNIFMPECHPQKPLSLRTRISSSFCSCFIAYFLLFVLLSLSLLRFQIFQLGCLLPFAERFFRRVNNSKPAIFLSQTPKCFLISSNISSLSAASCRRKQEATQNSSRRTEDDEQSNILFPLFFGLKNSNVESLNKSIVFAVVVIVLRFRLNLG